MPYQNITISANLFSVLRGKKNANYQNTYMCLSPEIDQGRIYSFKCHSYQGLPWLRVLFRENWLMLTSCLPLIQASGRRVAKLSAPFQPSCLPFHEWVICTLYWIFFCFIYISFICDFWGEEKHPDTCKIRWSKNARTAAGYINRNLKLICYAVFENLWNGMFNQENLYFVKEILKISTLKPELFRQVALFEYPVNKFIIMSISCEEQCNVCKDPSFFSKNLYILTMNLKGQNQ